MQTKASRFTLLLTAIVAASSVGRLQAEKPQSKAIDRERAAAERAFEIAALRLRRYERVEYPLALRRLESEIALTRAEIASHKRRITEYAQFQKNAYSSPLFFSMEQAKLALTEAELRLADTQKEKCLLIQFHGDQQRIYELEVEAACARLKALADRSE